MHYWPILIILLVAVGIIMALSPFNTTADGALAIISILTTLIVGISVVNTLELYNLKERIAKIDQIETRTEQIANRASILMMLIYGSQFKQTDDGKSLKYFLHAFIKAIKHDELTLANNAIQLAFNLLSDVHSESLSKSINEEYFTNEIHDIKNLKHFKNFTVFKKQADAIITIISRP